MTDDADSTEGLTYSEAGVDIDDSEAATAALVGAIGEFEGDYAGLIDIGGRYLALATDGVGTKLLVAERAELALVGGETAVMPEVIQGLDLAGACAGLATEDELFDGEAEPGDFLVGLPSSGIHSNGLTLAREAVTRDHAYTDPFPYDESRTIGEALLEPTRIYRELLDPLHAAETHAAAHITGGGWTNLERMGEHRYVIEDPFEVDPIFEFVQTEGDVSDEEMHRTFNMGTGFVAALPEADAERVAGELDDARVIGRVESGDSVSIRGLNL